MRSLLSMESLHNIPNISSELFLEILGKIAFTKYKILGLIYGEVLVKNNYI